MIPPSFYFAPGPKTLHAEIPALTARQGRPISRLTSSATILPVSLPQALSKTWHWIVAVSAGARAEICTARLSEAAGAATCSTYPNDPRHRPR